MMIENCTRLTLSHEYSRFVSGWPELSLLNAFDQRYQVVDRRSSR
jgi:hypothetical protein